MYINGKKLNVRRYSSGELKFLKSTLDKYVVDNKVRLLYVGNFSLFELLIVIKYYLNKGVLVDLVLGYLPYQRMDHKGRDELDTVNYISDIFNDLNLNSVTICEPHCDIDCFKNARSFSYVKNIRERVFEEINFDSELDYVVLTDKGGLKRYGGIAKNMVCFEKERDLETGLITKHTFAGKVDVTKKIVIVDDIISTGDTICNILEELSKMGSKNIYVLSGHLEDNKYNERIFECENVIKVFSTNSLKKDSRTKLKLYDVSEFFKFNN